MSSLMLRSGHHTTLGILLLRSSLGAFGHFRTSPLAATLTLIHLYCSGLTQGCAFMFRTLSYADFARCSIQNNLRLEQTFLTVDQWSDEQWTPVRSDSHPSTTYRWERTNLVSPKLAGECYCDGLTQRTAAWNQYSQYHLVSPPVMPSADDILMNRRKGPLNLIHRVRDTFCHSCFASS